MATRIRPSYVEALEAEDFDELGGEVYAKGFLRSYAGFLGLDPEPLVDAYRERYSTEAWPTAKFQSMRDSGMLAAKEPRRRGWLPISIACVLIVLLLGVWSLIAGRREQNAAPTVAAPQTTVAPIPTTTLPQTTTTSSTTLDEVSVALRFDGRSWASITVDGERAFRGILSKGAERVFTGKETVDVALGNAGGVFLTVNGTDLGRAGAYGRSFQQTFTVDDQRAGQDDSSEASDTDRRARTQTGTGTSRRSTSGSGRRSGTGTGTDQDSTSGLDAGRDSDQSGLDSERAGEDGDSGDTDTVPDSTIDRRE